MAKRRKLEAPSAEDLSRIEAEFRGETSPPMSRGVAPIASVVAESASETQTEAPEDRAARARAEVDAERYRDAQERGLLVAEIPTKDIEADAMIRDRMILDEDEMMELRTSIAVSGLRLPIEVYETAEGSGQFELLSGYRRLMAVRALFDLTEAEKYTRIRAIVRPRAEIDQAMIQMVEENEVRSELSNYERGRIAVISAQSGAFTNTEEAVAKLFSAGSKSKRSKVRSFATIFEELGDMLSFPEALTEKRGLRIAAALRLGAEPQLREALAKVRAGDAEEEWAAMEAYLEASEAQPRDRSRGGRPKSQPVAGWVDEKTIQTSTGITIERGEDSQGYILRFRGRGIDSVGMDTLMLEIQRILERV